MERSATQYQSDLFEVLAVVRNDDAFHDFISGQLKNRSYAMYVYFVFLFGITWVLISILFSRFSGDKLFEEFFIQLAIGIFFGLLMIPIHELIHGLYLKMLGCASIRYERDFARLQFGCYGDQYVLTKKEYYKFLLAPFLIITTVLLLLILVFNQFQVLFFAMILMHGSLCAGDFALVSFSSLLDESELFIYYDNKMKKIKFLKKQVENF